MVFVLSEKRVIKTWSNQIHSCYPFNKVVSWVLLLFCLYFALFLFVLPTAHADSINTAAVDGIVVYQEAVVQTPLYRIWNDSNKNFSEERTNTNAVGGLINFVVLKANHERDEMILGTEDQQADVNIQIINQTKNFTNLLEVSTSVDITSTRGFDIAYEDISGDALIVYENSGTVDAVFGYRIWNGTGYSSEVNITTPMLAGTGSPLRWVSLYPKRSSDDIMVLLHNNAGDLYAVLWNGSDFELNSGVNLSITTTTAVSEHFAFAWETASGDGLALYGTGTAVVRRNYTSATKTWGAEESESVGNGIDHLTVCSHPTNDYVGIIFVDGGADLNVRIWNGSRILSNSPTEDGTVETGGANNINIDCVWNGTNGNVAIFGFTDSNSLNLSYALFAVQNESWSATTLLSSIQTQDFASDDIQGLTFTKHPTTHEIMVVAEDLLEDITAIVWNGTGFQNISASPLETNTEVLNGGQNGVQFAWYQFDPAPNVTALVANPGTVPAAGIVNITVNVTDTIGVDVVLVNITHANGTVEQFRMTNGTGATPQFFNLTFLNTNDQGNFTVVIIANDTSTHKNINDTVQTTFTVDSTAPAVATLRPVFGSSQLNGSVINISATVTDAFQSVDSVRANISYINCILLLCTTKQETFLLQKVGNIYNYSFANTTDISEYNITFIANDTVGNLNITEKTNVSLINQDNFNPSLTSLRPAANSFTARNSVVNISATVTDNIGISITVANVTYPNNATTEQLLLIGVGSIFNYSFGNTSNEGYYNITFIATDLLGNINATEKTNVTVDSTGPAVANVQPVLESTEINGTIINISARVTDEWLNVDIVLANITYPDNTTKEQIRLQKTGNIYNYSFGNTTQNGIYNITFIANDTAGNLNFTQKTNVTMVVQDVINPVVTTLRPVANSFTARNSVVNMSANVTDNGGINTVFANVTYPNNATTEQLLLISFGSIFNYSFGNTSAEGYYNITFTATDLLGNINATEKTNVTVDSTAPSVANIKPAAQSNLSGNAVLNISAAVTDEWLNVDVVLANITYPDNTTKEQLRLQKVGGIYNFSFGNTTQNGIYNITFIANDTAGNLNFTQKTNITVDGLSPTVINVRPTPNNFTFVGSRINISAAVTDNLGISTVFANVTYPNNTTKEQLLLISVGSIFNYSFGNTSAEGYYNITFTATDLLGNINATEKTNVTVDSTGPAVRDATPVVNTSVTLNETVNISALVTDLFLSVDTVLANITYPNGSKEQLLMQKTGNIYNYTWTNVTQSGVYTITFIANDSLGNRNETQTASFRRITYNEDEPHFDLLNSDNASVTSYTSSLISNNSGLLTKQLDFSNFTFSRILILDFNESSYNSVMKVENATVDAGFSSTFAIDFSGLDFRSANVTVTAVGDEVYKCANFSFDTRTCLGSYVFLQTVVPGQNYTIVLNALDPGFGEKVSESEPSPAPAQEKSAAAAGGGAGGAGGLNDHIPSTVAAPEISAPDVPVLPTISIEVPFFTSIVPREESPLAEKKGLLSLALEEDGISFMRVLMYLLLVLFVTAGIFSFVSFTDIHVYRKTGFTALQQALIPFYIFRDALMYGWIILHHLKENIIGARYPHLEIKFFVRITLEEWKFALKEWSTRKAILLPVKYRFLEKVLRVE